MQEIYLKADAFLNYIFKCIDKEVFLSEVKLDHICFRTSTLDEYERYKTLFSSNSTLIACNQINGREITVFKTNSDFQHERFSTKLLELTQPKVERKDSTNFEHIEFVIQKELRKLVEENPHLNFNTKNIDAKTPEIRLNFAKGCIKFRNIALEDVIASER
jgi:uncharacterized protein